jgi:DNA-binding transcriptional regulator YbjK
MTHWHNKPPRKSRRAVNDLLAERTARRTAALIACISELSIRQGPDAVTHALVAEQVGVPLKYVQWKYPSHENLVAMARSSAPRQDQGS